MLRVAITDSNFPDYDIERAALAMIDARLDICTDAQGSELVALVRDADAVITQFARIDASVIAAMRRVRVIARYGIGYDSIDGEAARVRGMPLCNVPDYCTDEVADHALAMVLELTRRISENAAPQRRGEWRMATPVASLRALRDLVVGVVAFGRIGQAVCSRLRAFGATVLVHDPYAAPEAITGAGCTPSSLDELVARADLITLHCPSTAATRRLFDRARFARCRPGALLVNVARGDIVDSDALTEAVLSGRIGAAALDVFDPEPMPADHPLRKHPAVLINPHCASCSPRAVRALREGTVANVVRVLRGQPAVNVVNRVASATAAR